MESLLHFQAEAPCLKHKYPVITHVITGKPPSWTMINKTQITVPSPFFKVNTTEDLTHEDKPRVVDKELDERLNRYFTYCFLWCRWSVLQFVAFSFFAAFSM